MRSIKHGQHLPCAYMIHTGTTATRAESAFFHSHKTADGTASTAPKSSTTRTPQKCGTKKKTLDKNSTKKYKKPLRKTGNTQNQAFQRVPRSHHVNVEHAPVQPCTKTRLHDQQSMKWATQQITHNDQTRRGHHALLLPCSQDTFG